MSSPVQWRQVSIAEICEDIIDCVNRTAPTVETPTPYKMIRTTNVRDGWVDLTSVKYVDEATYERWTRRQIPRKGDVILTREAPLGEVGMIRTNDRVFLGQRLVSYRVNSAKADNRFLLYAFQASFLRDQIKALGSGSTVEHMRVPDAKQLQVLLPDLRTQRRVASILSAYDDLIENNNRRIAVLEEMAKRVHEEWFIRSQGTSSSGWPAGWQKVPLGRAVDFNPLTKVPKEGSKLFLPMSGLSETSSIVGPFERKEGNSGAKFRNGDTLVARITPCLENGKTGFVHGLPPEQPTACGSTEFIVLRSKTLCPEYVYLLARSECFRDIAIRSMSGATGRQRVRTESLEEMEIVQPDADTLSKFKAFAAPFFRQVNILAKQNTNLRAQRDLLLPKLISGEIDVSEAAELLEAAQ